MKKSLIVSFLPALVCWPIWIYCMSIKGAWYMAFSKYYPMTLAMVIGCFIAGSTPLGGAVTAFPVAVLVLKFTPVMGRDFSALIQSVGMSAAAYLILVRKKHLVNTDFVNFGCVASAFGIIIGSSVDLPAFWINVIYTTYTVSAACLLLYKQRIAQFEGASKAESDARSQVMQKTYDEVTIEEEKRFAHNGKDLGNTADLSLNGHSHTQQEHEDIDSHTFKRREDVRHLQPEKKSSDQSDERHEHELPTILKFGLILTCLLGGALTSKIGSGSDTLLYMYGVFIYNAVMPIGLPDSMLTASSVIVMAFSSIVLMIIRSIEGNIANEVYLCWGAVLWLVVVGAPIGSLALNKSREAFFRRLFYILAAIQFMTFAVLKIKRRVEAWIVVGSIFLLTLLGMLMHAYSRNFLRCLLGRNTPKDQNNSEAPNASV